MSDNPLIVSAREASVVLYPGDTEEQLDKLYEELNQSVLAERGTYRMGVPSAADALADRIEEQKEQMRAAGKPVLLRDPGSRRMQQLQEECPPREDHPRDQAIGLNSERFYQLAVRASIVEPVITDEQFEEFLASVGTFNWNKLVKAIDDITSTDVNIPKSSTVFVLAQMRENATKRLNDTA